MVLKKEDTEMYTITIENNKFSIPKPSLRYLAMQKAFELNKMVQLDTNEEAINFLNKLGIKVE